MNSLIFDADVASFQSEVVQRSFERPVLVDFWAAWCGPCKILGPTLERLATAGEGAFLLAKVDVDANQQLAMAFQVQGIPTVVAFKDGKPVNRFTGALSEAQVRQFIESVVPSELDIIAAQAERLWDEGEEEEASRLFGQALEQDPTHQVAGLGLAGMMLEKGERITALDILSRLAPTEEVRRLQAVARLEADTDLSAYTEVPTDPSELLAYARALAAAGDYQSALDHLLEVVAMRLEGISETARVTVLDLFEVLGADSPITAAYRKRLASALF